MTYSKSIRTLAVGATALVAGGLVWLAGAPAAQACGGFFCSQIPVEQTAEQIIFIHDEDAGEVTAVIQIQYSGPADSFAWLLPVPGTPKPGVSSNTAFERLRGQTDPQYNLDVEIEGTCKDGGFVFDEGIANAAPSGAAGSGVERSDSDVTVLDEGSVGPYDYATIMVNPSLPDKADAAVEWLTENEFDVTAIGPDVLRPYLEDGLNLIAFKLQKGTPTGSIRPVVLTYESQLPMIPIRPTRVAAQDDMGVRVWMVAKHQAIPKNYKSLVLNEALIDWFCWSCSYDQVVSAAADEAGGHGFVSELGAPSSDYEDSIWSDYDQTTWDTYMATTFVDGYDAIDQASGRYRFWEGWREAVCGSLTLPAGLDCDTFGRSPDAYRDQVQVDETGFITALWEKVVKPVKDAQAFVTMQPYMTRLYTTMSPEEMTEDPLFDINGDLADISNVHTAKQIIECSPDVYQWNAPWRIELPQGGVIRGEEGQYWPIDLATTTLPANHKIVQLSTEGAGMVIEDNTEMISRELFDLSGMNSAPTTKVPLTGSMIGGNPEPGTGTPGDGSEPGGMAGDGSEASDNSGGGFCAVGAPSAGGGATLAAWLLAIGYVASRRRRR